MEKDKNKKQIAFLFDVDGVIIESPHEKSWREAALSWGLISEDFNFTDLYQKYVAGIPGLQGAEIILEKTDYYKKQKTKNNQKEVKAKEFRETKQKILDKCISKGEFKVFEDVLNIIKQAKEQGIPIAAVSSSENAEKILRKINLLKIFDSTTLGAIKYRAVNKEALYSFAFGKLCGRVKINSLSRPVIFEDADKGVVVAKNIGYLCIGIARKNLTSPHSLIIKGADLAYDDTTLLKKGYQGIMQDLILKL